MRFRGTIDQAERATASAPASHPRSALAVTPIALLHRSNRLRFAVAGALIAAAATSFFARPVSAQQPTARRDTVPRPTVPPPVPADTAGQRADTTAARAPRRPRPAGASPIPRPPISARRAFIYSALVPGLGQARLDRAATGAFFMFVEAGALAMVAKSSFDLAEAKALRGDSLVINSIPVDSTGHVSAPITSAQRLAFTAALVRARRVHVEDWLAVVAFNHLIAGAEAYVSANLWDVPGEVAVRPSRNGTTLSMRMTW